MSAPTAAGPAIEARGVVNRFGAQVVHDGLDMTVQQGEVYGIVGGSGSGKSVLLRTILGLQRPQAGEVRIFGTDLTRLADAELRAVKAMYGVTFQAGALFSSLTVLQNVQLPMLEHLSLPQRALDELAMLKVRLVGLSPEAAAKYPAQLSGGMVKRAALARATVALMNAEEARLLTGEEDAHAAARALRALGPETVAVTDGAHPALLATAEGVETLPVVPAEVVFDIGAGDTFHAGYLAAWTSGMGPRESARFALHAAALKISRPPDPALLPTRADVLAAMSAS